jgi:hypothetical protein
MTVERAVLKSIFGGQVEARNVFTASVTEVGGDTSPILWDVYMDMLLADICPVLHEGVHFYGYDVYKQSGDRWELIDEVSVNYVGEISGEAILNAAAVVLIGKAGGIRHFGRKFFGLLPESMTNNNTMIAGAATALAASLLDYISPVTGIGGGTLVPGIMDSGSSFHPFVGGTVSSLLGTMRRRKPGIGI